MHNCILKIVHYTIEDSDEKDNTFSNIRKDTKKWEHIKKNPLIYIYYSLTTVNNNFININLYNKNNPGIL